MRSPDRSHALVIGGSVAGLATALALAQDGRRVTVLERDPAEPPARAALAFDQWDRRGSAQTHQSHAFLARLHNLLRDRAPQLLEALFAAGAEPLRFRDMAEQLMPDAVFVPEDDEITLIACRRTTFEWVLRRHVAAQPGVRVESGVRVLGLPAIQSDDPRVECDPGSAAGYHYGRAVRCQTGLGTGVKAGSRRCDRRLGRFLRGATIREPRWPPDTRARHDYRTGFRDRRRYRTQSRKGHCDRNRLQADDPTNSRSRYRSVLDDPRCHCTEGVA